MFSLSSIMCTNTLTQTLPNIPFCETLGYATITWVQPCKGTPLSKTEVACDCAVAVSDVLPWQGAVVAIENPDRRIFGLQYHPEVMHTEQGTDTIRHFLLDIAGLKADWTMAEVLETQLKLIEQQVGGRSAGRWVQVAFVIYQVSMQAWR